MGGCVGLTEQDVTQAFLAAPPLVNKQILDLTVKHPNWLGSMFETETWPLGNGTIMEQILFRGEMPQIERGLDQWKKLPNNSGCSPCDGPDCAYNWTPFGGTGMERKIVQLMSREFKSPSYCVKEIQTTMQFREVFAKIVENLFRQVDFFKEQNIGLNVFTSLSKKFVVDSGGIKFNRANPYVYPNIGTAQLSTLNIGILAAFYEWMRRIPDVVAYDYMDGAPIFAMSASAELLQGLYLNDAQLRQDARFSDEASNLLKKFNFQTVIRQMFIAAPILFPRRFNIVAGEPVEVLPYIKGIPMEVGSFTGINPAYMAATHEEVLLNGKYPFKIYHMPTTESLGQNTSFGPEPSFFDNWQWINPRTQNDPFRRVGYFATGATLGIANQYSDGLFSILIARPSQTQLATFLPPATCPPEAVECDNEIPAVGCPCPLIVSVTPNPVVDGDYFVVLSVPREDLIEDATFQLGIDTGGYVTATVVAVSDDFKTFEVTLDDAPPIDCDHFTFLYCDETLGCSSLVLETSDCAAGVGTNITVILKNPIKAITDNDVVTAYLSDGSSLAMALQGAPDLTTNTWTLDYSGAEVDFICQHGGIVSLCVPTATDASCPGCGGPVGVQCES